MRFEGFVERRGSRWVAEIPALNAMTQGRTKRETYEMVADLVETMADASGFRVTVYTKESGRFELAANDVPTLVSLLLRRQREKSGLTLAQAAARLRQTSRNAYARYELRQSVPSIEKLEQLLAAVAPGHELVWRIAS